MGQPIVINEEEIGLSMILAVKVAVVEEKTKFGLCLNVQALCKCKPYFRMKMVFAKLCFQFPQDI